jgi:hypothetical protein
MPDTNLLKKYSEILNQKSYPKERRESDTMKARTCVK